MIKYIHGDVFNSNANVIAHGCNCRGGYGSGFAYQVKTKFPKAMHAYFQKYNSLNSWKLGEVQLVEINPNFIIANCATQDAYLPRGKRHADYEAIKKCMIFLYEYVKKNQLTIAIPKIGSDLAGGDWNIIEKIINDVFTDIEITVYIYKK